MTNNEINRHLRPAAFARIMHGDQQRKYTGDPYWTHLMEVAAILDRHGMPDEVVAAGWLHDTLEDTEATEEMLLAEFGDYITQLVLEVTDVSKPEDGNRAVRKKLDREHLANSSGYGAAIKLADIISNTKDIAENDPKFAVVYLKEKDELMAVLYQGPESLYEEAMATLREARIKLGVHV